mgnify:CR=1 FL=1
MSLLRILFISILHDGILKSGETFKDVKSLSLLPNKMMEYGISISSNTENLSSFFREFKIAIKNSTRNAAFSKQEKFYARFISENFSRSGGNLGNILVLREKYLLFLNNSHKKLTS